MSAREGIFNYLTGRAVCPTPRPAEEAEGLLAAYRAEVLREAADDLEASALGESLVYAAARLRRRADGAEVEEKSSPAGADATPEPEPYTDSKTAFMQIGTAQWPRRAVLHLEGLPPLVGTYNGAGMRRLDHHDGLIVEPMLAFADRPETTGKDGA